MGTLSTAVRNAMNDGGSSLYNSGKLELLDGSSNILAVFTLASTAFGASSAGSKALAGTPLSTTGTAAASTGTTVASARFRTSADADLETAMTVSITGGGGQVQLDNLSIAEDQTVNCTGYTFVVPASTTAT